MAELVINRDRAALMRDVADQRIYRSAGGCDLRQVRAGQNQRVDRKLRELRDAGWAELGADGRAYTLTAEGRAELARYTEVPGG